MDRALLIDALGVGSSAEEIRIFTEASFVEGLRAVRRLSQKELSHSSVATWWSNGRV